ncbi:MAG: mercury resistance system transport protein MerF [Rhodospirillales bacterium]
MTPDKITLTGGAGSAITAVCCFTPILAVTLPAIGLATWLGWIDYVLFPMLAAFIGLTGYGLWRRRAAACCTPAAENRAGG